MGKVLTKMQNRRENLNSLVSSTSTLSLSKLAGEKLKIVLLGSGESGKSTIFKQLRIKYSQKFDENYLSEQVRTVTRTFISSFDDFINAIERKLGRNKEVMEFIDKTKEYYPVLIMFIEI